ncbi:hypothetical protein Tco_1574256, partial [Tanacetum coccineum]
SSLLSRETFLDVNDAFAIVSREESHRGIASSSSNSVTKPQIYGFVSKTNNWSNNWNKIFDNKKFGNSSNNNNNNGNNRGPNPNLLCKNYNKVGHTVDRCFDLIGYPPSENGATLSFTYEQIMKLMNLINDVPSGNMQANMAASHPNGTLEKIKYVGNLKLSDNVVLFDDLHHNKIMGTGSENGGLNLFDTPFSFSFNCQTLGNLTATCYVFKSLWHNKLGHPFDQVVDVL